MTLRVTALCAAILAAASCLAANGAVAVEHRDSSGPISPQEMDALPGDSLYRLPVTLTTAAGVSMHLSELRGKPLIVTMFYSQCASVCPLLTSQLQRLVERIRCRSRHAGSTR